MKAIIIGAGIGGLMTAIALEKQGIEVEIYEQASQISAVGAGLTLWANAIAVFKALGMSEALMNLGAFEGQGAIRSSRGITLTAASVNQHGKRDSIASIIVHRADLHKLLEANFHGSVQLGHKVTHYSQTSQGVTVHFENNASAEGDVLIAADGIHSVIRGQMYPQIVPQYAGYTAYRAVVQYEHAQVGGVWGETWGPGRRFGLAPLSGNRVYWFGTENTPEGRHFASGEAMKAHVQSLFVNWHSPIPQLIAVADANDLLHHDIYDIPSLNSWVDGRVALLGDAAHAMTPNLGQGACQAIEDAYAIAHYLVGVSNINDALKQYQEVRLPRTTAIKRQSHQIGSVGQIENPLICWVRNQVVRIVPESIRDRGLNTVVNYRIDQVANDLTSQPTPK